MYDIKNYKNDFLEHFKRHLNKLYKDDKLDDSIRDALKVMDIMINRGLNLTNNTLSPHTFENMWASVTKNKGDRNIQGNSLSSVHYNEIAQRLLQDRELLNAVAFKMNQFRKSGEEQGDLYLDAIALMDDLLKLKDGETIEYGDDSVTSEMVQNVIRDIRQFRVEIESQSGEIAENIKRKLDENYIYTEYVDEDAIDERLEEFLRVILKDGYPGLDEADVAKYQNSLSIASRMVKDVYRSCYGANKLLDDTVVFVSGQTEREFVDFVKSKYADLLKKDGLNIDDTPVKVINRYDLLIEYFRENPSQYNQLLREEIRLKYGEKVFVTEAVIWKYTDSVLEELKNMDKNTYNKWCMDNLYMMVDNLDDIKNLGQGEKFLKFLNENRGILGVYESKIGPYDMFSATTETVKDRKVEIKLPSDELIARQFINELTDKISEETGLDFNHMKTIAKGNLDLNLGGSNFYWFNVNNLIEEENQELLTLPDRDIAIEKIISFQETLKRYMIRAKEKELIIRGLEPDVANQRAEIEVDDALLKIGDATTVSQNRFENLYTLSKQMELAQKSGAEDLLKFDIIKEFEDTMKLVKKEYDTLCWEAKNELSGGWCLNKHDNSTDFIRNMGILGGKLGIVKQMSQGLVSESVAVKLNHNALIDVIDDKIGEYVDAGHGRVVNYLNPKDATEHEIVKETRNIKNITNLDQMVEDTLKNPIPRVDLGTNLELLSRMKDLLVKVNGGYPNDGATNDNVLELIKTYNKLTQADGDFANPISLKNKNGLMKGITSDRWVDRTKDLATMESFLVTKLAEYNIFHRDVEDVYEDISKRIGLELVDIKEYMPNFMLDEIEGLTDSERLYDPLTVKKILIQKSLEIENKLYNQSKAENELSKIFKDKEKLLEKTVFLEKRDETIQKAVDFISANMSTISANLSTTGNYFTGITIPEGIFFKTEELENIYKNIKEVSKNDNFLSNLSILREEKERLTKSIFVNIDNKIIDSEEGYSGDETKETMPLSTGRGGEGDVERIARSRLQRDQSEDRDAAYERIKEEVRVELKEKEALDTRREKIKKLFDKIPKSRVEASENNILDNLTQKEFSDETKRRADYIKEKAIEKADKEYNDVLGFLMNKYGLDRKAIIESAFDGKVIDISNIDEKTIADLKKDCENLSVFDRREEDKIYINSKLIYEKHASDVERLCDYIDEIDEQARYEADLKYKKMLKILSANENLSVEIKDGYSVYEIKESDDLEAVTNKFKDYGVYSKTEDNLILLNSDTIYNEYYVDALISYMENGWEQGVLTSYARDNTLGDTEVELSDIKDIENAIRLSALQEFTKIEINDERQRCNAMYISKDGLSNYEHENSIYNKRIVELSKDINDISLDNLTEINSKLKSIEENIQRDKSGYLKLVNDIKALYPMVPFENMSLKEIKEFIDTNMDDKVVGEHFKKLDELISDITHDKTGRYATRNTPLNDAIFAINKKDELCDYLNGEDIVDKIKDYFKYPSANSGYADLIKERLHSRLFMLSSPMFDVLSPHYGGISTGVHLISVSRWLTTLSMAMVGVTNLAIYHYTKRIEPILRDYDNFLKDHTGMKERLNILGGNIRKKIENIKEYAVENEAIDLSLFGSNNMNPYIKKLKEINFNAFPMVDYHKNGNLVISDADYTTANLTRRVTKSLEEAKELIAQLRDNPTKGGKNEIERDRVLNAYEKSAYVLSYYLTKLQSSVGLNVSKEELKKIELECFEMFNRGTAEVKGIDEITRNIKEVNGPELWKRAEETLLFSDKNYASMEYLIEEFGKMSNKNFNPTTNEELLKIIRNANLTSELVDNTGKVNFNKLMDMIADHESKIGSINAKVNELVNRSVSDEEKDRIAQVGVPELKSLTPVVAVIDMLLNPVKEQKRSKERAVEGVLKYALQSIQANPAMLTPAMIESLPIANKQAIRNMHERIYGNRITNMLEKEKKYLDDMAVGLDI